VRFLVGITGASGAVYGVRLVERLLDEGREVDVIVSPAARRVLAVELDRPGDPRAWLKGRKGRAPRFHDDADLAALPASGSSTADAMLVAPCSMGTAARIVAGVSGTLIERAADVILKERRPLVLVPRETPLSTLHLRNLLELSTLGARIVPAMPAFYFGPKDMDELVEFVVDRALQAAGAGLPLRHPWLGLPEGEA
jgi:4-hydroxy-3-polyprenylbenzoate decarboxylase